MLLLVRVCFGFYPGYGVGLMRLGVVNCTWVDSDGKMTYTDTLLCAVQLLLPKICIWGYS